MYPDDSIPCGAGSSASRHRGLHAKRHPEDAPDDGDLGGRFTLVPTSNIDGSLTYIPNIDRAHPTTRCDGCDGLARPTSSRWIRLPCTALRDGR